MIRTGTSSGRRIVEGNGSPEGVVSGSRGDIYLRKDGSTGQSLYTKQSGDATTTGWIAITDWDTLGFNSLWLSADAEQWIGTPTHLPTQINRTYGANIVTLRLLGLDQDDYINANIKTPAGYTGGAILTRSVFTFDVAAHGTRTFAIGMNAMSNGDSIPVTVSGESTFSIAETANGVTYFSSIISVTPQNTPAAGDLIMIRLRRTADGIANQADFIGMEIGWPV